MLNNQPEIQLYDRITETQNPIWVSVKEIADRIKSDKYKDICRKVSELYIEEQKWAGIDEIKKKEIKRQRQKIKESIPNVIFASHMSNDGIGYEYIQNVTGLVAMDFDDVQDLDATMQKIITDPNIHLRYKTPSHGGLRILVKTNLQTLVDNFSASAVESLSLKTKITDKSAEMAMYKSMYEYLYFFIGNKLSEKYDIVLDKKAKDVTRRNYLAYDPGCFYNPDSTVFEAPEYVHVQEKTIKKSETKEKKGTSKQDFSSIYRKMFDHVIDYVEENKIDITEDYQDWIYLAWLCKFVYGPDENEIKINFHRLSQYYQGYNTKETDLKIRNIIKDESNRNTVFFALRNILLKYKLAFLFDSMANDFIKVKPFQLQEIFSIEKVKIVFDEIKEVHVISCPSILDGKEIVLEDSGDFCLNHIITHLEQKYKVTFKAGDVDRNLKTSPNKGFYNRPKDVLSKVKTSDPEYYTKFFELIEFDLEKNDLEYYKTLFTRWLLGCFHNWLRTDKRKYDEMLVLSEPRGNIGKTNFINDYLFSIFKTTLFTYISENKNFGDNKDKDFHDSKSLIAYKSEIHDDLKKRYGNVKTYMSQRHVQVRNPYSRYTGDYISTCSYIGDTNEYNFLPSEVNLRRFLVIPIIRLNFSDKTMRKVTPFDWYKFWGYLYWLWTDGGKDYVDFEVKNQNENYIDETKEISILRKILVRSNGPVSIHKIHQDISSNRELNLNINIGELKKVIQNLGFRTTTSVRCKISGKVVRGWNCQVDSTMLYESVHANNVSEVELPVDFFQDRRNGDRYKKIYYEGIKDHTLPEIPSQLTMDGPIDEFTVDER